MPITRWFVPFSLLLTAGAHVAWAHPGHGTTDPTAITHIAEPWHLLPVLVSMGVISVILWAGVRRVLQVRAQNAKQNLD